MYFSTNFVNPSEAPKGYYAVSKKSFYDLVGIKPRVTNICTECDWRKDCSASVCSCMSYNRKDKMSVVFKKLS